MCTDEDDYDDHDNGLGCSEAVKLPTSQLDRAEHSSKPLYAKSRPKTPIMFIAASSTAQQSRDRSLSTVSMTGFPRALDSLMWARIPHVMSSRFSRSSDEAIRRKLRLLPDKVQPTVKSCSLRNRTLSV